MIKNPSWVVEELPENYQEMIFFSPDCHKCNFYFMKKPSKIDILNDPNSFVHKILKSLRDNKNYINKLSKIKYNVNTFKEAKSKKLSGRN